MPELAAAKGDQLMPEPLRFVFIGPSIRSSWNNPAASTHRAVLAALGERGHQSTFLEARRNAAVEGLLANEGSEALLSFDRDFPSIDYRSYDPPPSRELRVWLGRESATADVAVLLDGMSREVVEAFERTEVLELRRLIERPDPGGSVLIDIGSDRAIVRYSSLTGENDPIGIAWALEGMAAKPGLK